MAKQMVFDDEARQPLLAGVSKLARAVRSTLGPRGRNAVLDKGWGSPKVTKDGVTVAEDIELDDPYENLGAQLVKEAASKTNDVAGDGTTTATVLAEAIFREGLKMIAAGADPMALSPRHRQGRRSGRRSDRASMADADRREEQEGDRSRSPRSPATTIPSIGSVLADAFLKVGKDGVITVEEGRSSETTVEVVEGMQFDRGYPLAALRHQSRRRQTVELENCLHPDLTKKRSRNAKKLGAAARSRQQGQQAAADHRRRRRRRSPGDAGGQQDARHPAGLCREGPRLRRSPQGDARRPRPCSPAARRSSRTWASSSTASSSPTWARPRRSRITSDNTTIVGGAGKKDEIDGRAEQIRREIENTDSEYDREKLQERLAKLAGGVAQINCGAATETEMKERKALLEDAKAATQAALARRHRPRRRRGSAPLRKGARQARRSKATKSSASRSSATCSTIRCGAIAENAGVDGAVVVNRVRQMKGKNDGYDADKDEYGDLVAAGIIDPAKVVRTALQNAASVAALLLTTESLIAEIPKEEEDGGRRSPSRPRHGWNGRHGRHGWHGRNGRHGHGMM